MKTITFQVPDSFVIPPDFNGMSEEEVAFALTIASHLPSFCKNCVLANDVEEIVKRLSNGESNETNILREKLQSATSEISSIRTELKLARETSESHLQIAVHEATNALRTRLMEEHENVRRENRDKIEALEMSLRKSLQTQCDLRDSEGKREREMSATIMELRSRVNDLERPTSVGRVAEIDVAGIFRGAGFHVQDTSMGESKEAGFLDLLIEPEEVDTASGSNMRIAVEVKNVKTVQRKDLDDFDIKVKQGISSGKFDAALFLSLRSHTKKKGAVHVEMVPDGSGKPVVPVVWLGTDRGKNAQPITQEVIESMAHMLSSLLSKCHDMRRDLDTAEDVDMSKVQTLVSCLSEHFTGLFTDLTKQCKTLDDLRSQLTQTRARCIVMFHSLWATNRDVSWLSRDMSAPWMDAFLLADSQTATMKESEIWNRLSKQKTTVERYIGKEAMFEVLRSRKRSRESVVPNDDEPKD